MTRVSPTVVYLPGGGGGSPDWSVFKASEEDSTRFEAIEYPGWRRFVADGFSAEVLISEIAAQIVAKVPEGPIRIVGSSIGGHFGYAAALRLQAISREIAGFCAIDTFMITSSEPRPGWKKRHLEEGLRLLRERRFHDVATFLRSRFWRAQLRLLGDRAPGLLRRLARSERRPAFAGLDPILEKEMDMRFLMREVAPWIASLDRDPVALNTPAALLRTELTAGDDPAWRRRCPNIEIIEIAGDHNTFLEADNVCSFHEAFVAATRDWRRDRGRSDFPARGFAPGERAPAREGYSRRNAA
jgi:thioesterase domain-containing protein